MNSVILVASLFLGAGYCEKRYIDNATEIRDILVSYFHLRTGINTEELLIGDLLHCTSFYAIDVSYRPENNILSPEHWIVVWEVDKPVIRMTLSE